ncbi:septal ring lytic transglycosylase RlpA family protein [Pontibacter sp. JH31]|uniref:Probable endolytic peptidoglycan transglycosylase RlpA n=1 Tax=Pontibacter aquaedesilientis TaxID=2766980 RepID=A0ABR7XGC1_9BACT|nr:septal ring lytic transglycosylase RlpA family protein [Pontibacter aquaedesilientis]MBD1397314.1 septal ring lytic transglycosylase RlpA family protein [Pontibacter aquaedesilientis]
MKNDRKCFILTVIIFLFIGVSQPTFAQSNDITQIGSASWYGSKYHGRKTSSGERYNKNEMTAAHKTLPFGTMVKVTNPANKKSVVLRINDRGPFVGNRIIDVSEAAARKLEIHASGVAKVKVEVLDATESGLASAAPSFNATGYTIQTIETTDYQQAVALSQKLKAFDKHLPLEIAEEQVNGKKVVLVKAGKFNNINEAEAFNELLEEEGLAGKVREA